MRRPFRRPVVPTVQEDRKFPLSVIEQERDGSFAFQA